MNNQIRIIDPVSDEKWDQIVEKTNGSFFFLSDWARILKKNYRYRPLYFCLSDPSSLKGYIPVMEVSSILTGKRGISLPFSDICNFYADTRTTAELLINAVMEYGKSHCWKSMEWRGGECFPADTTPLTRYIEHYLDLTVSTEELYRSLKDSVKRNIKKSAAEGVSVEWNQSSDGLRDFIRLNKLTRKRHGLPPQPDSFFAGIDECFRNGRYRIVTAKYHHKAIASALYFVFNGQVLYKYGASDFRFQNLRANNLLMWEAIKMFKEEGYKSFSFGRTYPEHHGLMQFKNGFTRAVRDVFYYKFDFRQNTFVSDPDPEKSFVNDVFRKMPINILSFIGRILYRHFA